jgi:GT2 family glycosyltransferase
MIDLSIIIVNWNTKQLLLDCLSSIFKNTKGLNYEVIIVDNASTDGSTEEIKNLKLKIKNLVLIENKTNLGFAKANNQGIKIAKGRYILLLNSDTKIVDNSLKKLVDFAKTKPNLGVLGPRLLNKDGSFQPSVGRFFTLPWAILWLMTGDKFLYSSPSQSRKVEWVMGAAFLVSRQAIEKAGLLDENFFMYMEEVEWCWRIKKSGLQIWFYSGAEIYHLVRGSSPEGKQKAILWIYRGLIYFYQKHFAPWQVTMLKLALRIKAVIGWLVGVLTANKYLKETYAKAFKMVR